MIAIENVSKAFPGVQALDDVSFTIGDGEVHGLVGENGAGKSTLIKILSGIYPDYEGGISIDGEPVRFASVHDAQSRGVATIFQELTVIRELSVAENIFLGREPVRRAGGWTWNAMCRRSRRGAGLPRRPAGPPRAGGQPLGGQPADRGDLQGAGARIEDHHHGRAHLLAHRPRGAPALPPHPPPAGTGDHHPLRLPQDRGDLRDLRLRHRAARREAHRHGAPPRDLRPTRSSA